MAGIRQASADGRGDGPDGAHQGEDRDLALAQAVLARQLQGGGGPEQAERGEQATLVEGALTQHRLLAQQAAQGMQQLAVGGAVGRLTLGNGEHQHQADGGHQHGCGDEHRPPAKVVGHHAGHRAGQENPQQQAAHDPAHHPAAGFLGGQVRGQGNQNLHRHRTEADQQRHQEKGIGLLGKGRAQQAGNRQHGGADHQPAVFQQVTQGHQEEQAQGVADLGQGYDQAGQRTGQAEVRGDQLDDRLRIVDVGDDGPAAEGEQQHHAAGHCRAAGWQHLGRGSHWQSLEASARSEVKGPQGQAVKRAGWQSAAIEG